MELEVIKQKAQEIETGASRILTKLESEWDYSLATEAVRENREVMKLMDEFFDPTIKAAHEAHKKAKAMKDQLYKPREAFADKVRSNMADYQRAMQAVREQAERDARAELENQRKALEDAQKAQAIEDTKEATKARTDATTRATEAQEAMSRAQEQAENATVTMGAKYIANWKARVVDLKALIAAVSAGEVPLDAIVPDSVWLNKMAKALKDNLRYAGVEAYDDGYVR